MKKKALIFGIGGLSGIYLGKELQQNGYEVYGVDLKPVKPEYTFDGFHQVDITDQKAVADVIYGTNPTHIFNLTDVGGVGAGWKHPQSTVSLIVNGTLNILEAVKTFVFQPRVLLVGSGDEYAPSVHPLREDSPIRANSGYGIAKQAQENIAHLYHEKYGIDIYLIRQFNHTGIGQDERFSVASWVSQASRIVKGNQPNTLYVGNTMVSRDYLDVRDLVKAYRLVIESEDSTETYNVGFGKAYLLKELVQYVISLTGREDIKVAIDHNQLRPSDNPIICCNRMKITKYLGWTPEHEIHETIKEMYDDYMKR